jgi:hypothetical protein
MWRAAMMALAVMASSSALAADDGVWSVSKSSGEGWITAPARNPLR